ncbi:hypothetical protein HNP99_002084 [Flavobacterium sp. 28A]|uniref:T9SS C-terminal target domain-containing protein n=1 Tax=Flavobacterium sp. 28A TaxID=2735895 RepID=UPI00156E787E|nr:T9SS C-terminal target domain-containing protein [Flavobacterium sp. 28A]NRT15727.1 hypothetical protein [Flavobacterium sp. 28A]
MKIIALLLFLFSIPTYAQIAGCTDPSSKNYNPLATINNGSCKYRSIKLKALYSNLLPENLKESSGLLFYNSLLWTFNDNSDKALYAIDSIGNNKQKIKLEKVVNKDWEEISQDSSFIYIGDFGNNVSGNRQDLHILRIKKNTFESTSPKIDTISFKYSNQTDFTALKPNKTQFDCEAFIVMKDSIYLFTKQWKDSKTSVYVLPKTPGKYIAQFKETYNLKGLITGATYSPEQQTIALCGYSKTLQPFIYLLYDYKGSNFFSGNKRKIKLKLPFHQVEGIASQDGLHYYLTNEKFTRKPFIDTPQKLHQFNLTSFLSQ